MPPTTIATLPDPSCWLLAVVNWFSLGAKPSEIFARNIWVCTVEEPLGLSFYPHIGEDKILAETDYPHADTTYPYVQKSFEEVFAAAGLPDSVVEKVTHRNAERLFDWTMADESLYISPDVSSWRGTLESDPFAALKQRVEDAYGAQVAAILPLSEDMLELASGGVFCLHHPNHSFTAILRTVADQIA